MPLLCCLDWPFRSQRTCLMLAAKSGYSKVITLLMAYGAEINAQDEHGFTVSHRFFIQLLNLTWYKLHNFPLQALSVAVQQGRQEAVLTLLQLGADKTIKTKTGESPADLAAIVKNAQVPFLVLWYFQVWSRRIMPKGFILRASFVYLFVFINTCRLGVTKPAKTIARC